MSRFGIDREARAGHVCRRRMLRLAFALPLVAIAAGCGQKGPLYHPPQPDDEPNDDETGAAPAAPDSRFA